MYIHDIGVSIVFFFGIFQQANANLIELPIIN